MVLGNSAVVQLQSVSGCSKSAIKVWRNYTVGKAHVLLKYGQLLPMETFLAPRTVVNLILYKLKYLKTVISTFECIGLHVSDTQV